MPALRLKLAGALLAGGLAGVAAFSSLSSASGPQLAPASDSTDTSTQQTVESPAPCPAGTVEKGDSCEKVVTTQSSVEPADEVESDDPTPAPAPAQPAPAPAWTQQTPTSHESADEAQEPAEEREPQDADEHDGDGQQVEPEDSHQDEPSDGASDGAEHETDD